MPAGDNNVKITIQYGVKGKKTIKQAEKDIKALGKKTTKANASMQHGMSSTMGSLESLGNRFRYLSLVVSTASVLMVTGITNFTHAAMEAEEAMLGLSAEANAWGRDFSQAEQLVQNMTDTGLIPFNKAAEIVRNLMGTGLDIEVTEKAIKSLMDRAVVSREQQYSYADAIVATTRGIRYQREQLADATLIQGLFNLANEEATKITGKTTAQLTKLEKAYAVVSVITQESEKYTGMTEKAQMLLVGALGSVSAAVFDLKRAFGDALKPIIGPMAELIAKLSKGLQFLVEHMSGLVGMVIMTTAVMTGLFAVLATVGAILPMLTSGFAGVKIMLSGISIMSGLATMSLAKFALVSMGITAGLAILTYTILKLTGGWDRYADGFKNVMAGMQGANDAMKDLGKVHSEVTDSMSGKEKKQMEERRIQHQRRLEDLDEELKREISKGLWADQIKIKDLKKRIKRENEDWNRYLSDKESGQEDMSQTIADLMKGEADEVKKQINKMKMTWRDYIDWLSKWETWRDSLNKIIGYFSSTFSKIVEIFTDKESWKEIYDAFEKLPTIVQAMFGGLTTLTAVWILKSFVGPLVSATKTIALAFATMKVRILLYFAAIKAVGVATAIKLSFLAMKDAILGYFATIRTAWIGLATTISAPIALAIVITGALYAIQKIRDQITGLKNDIDGLSEASKGWEQMMKNVQERYDKGEISREQYLRYIKEIQEGQKELSGGIKETEFGWGTIWEGLTTKGGSSNIMESWFPKGYADGGIVPGQIGAPQPAIVHGGETIIPANQSAITININNPIVREQNDINRIANAVSQVMGQRAKWAKMGA